LGHTQIKERDETNALPCENTGYPAFFGYTTGKKEHFPMSDLTHLPKVIAIHCEKLNAQVNVTVNKWEPDRDGNEEFLHFWAVCPCGTEHVGFARYGYAEVAAEIAIQTSRDVHA
jgi:hypothetical protein